MIRRLASVVLESVLAIGPVVSVKDNLVVPA